MIEEGRLIIKEIVVQDYKSYAGRNVIGPFHPQFSCIVGPNGSGKSNIIDAILFVFGFKARKMRQLKLKGLIHKSASHSDCKKARVEVHFERVIGNDPIPGSQFTFAREVNSDNTAKYYIEDRPTTYTEVANRLRQYGVDIDHNRFLILQGEVEQIALMKPKAQNPNQIGLLEYIEDIIGTNEYIPHIQEKEKEIADINVIRDDATGRMNHARKERDVLFDAKTEADNYLSWKRELKSLQAAQVNLNKARAEERMVELVTSLEEAKKEYSEFETKIKELKEVLEKKKEERSVHEDLLRKQQHVLDKIMNSLRESKNHVQTLKLEIDSLEKENEENSKSITRELNSKSESEKETTELNEKIKAAKATIEDLLPKLDEAKKELAEMDEEIKEKTSELQKSLVDAQTKYSSANAEYINIQSTIQKYQNEVDSIKKAVRDNAEMAAADTKKLEEARKNLEVSLEAKQALEGKPEEERIALDNLKNELSQYEKDLEDKLEQRRQLSETVNSWENSMTENELCARVKNANIPGYCGRLAELGRIDKKYQTAMSAAAQGALNHLVVETVEAAKACVSFVNKNNLGRTTCIILDKAKEQQKNPNIPNGAVRLFDLIECDEPRYLRAFYFVLRDTLYAETLEEAQKLGYRGKTRFRVVTRDGEEIGAAGTMTGGGKGPAYTGAVMLSFDQNQLNEKKRELEKLNAEIDELKNLIRNTREQIRKLNPDQQQAKYDVLDVKVKGLEEIVAQLEEKISRIGNVEISPEDQQKVDELEANIAKYTPIFEERRKAEQEAKHEISEIQKQISQAGGPEYAKKRKLVDSTQKEITSKQKAVAASESRIENLKRAVERANSNVERIKDDMNKNAERLAELQPEKTKADAELDEVQKSVNEAKEKAEELNSRLKVACDTYDSAAKEVEELVGESTESQEKINGLEEEIEAQRQQADKWEKRLEGMNVSTEELAEHENKDPHEIELEMASLQEKIDGCDPNLSAIEEYRQRDEAFKAEEANLARITAERAELQKAYDNLRLERLDKFRKGFTAISNRLKELYQMLTLGGDAELELPDKIDPFAEGVNFWVKPPGKSWKHLENLSGGERTISSLSLVFAMHQFKPTPLYIMDEIDAALDFRNVSIIANYLRERTTDAQFIVISLRNNMFELANKLIGIFKLNDCTSTIVIEPSQFVSSGNQKDQDPETENDNNQKEEVASEGATNQEESAE